MQTPARACKAFHCGYSDTEQGQGRHMPKPIDATVVEARMRDLAQTAVNQTVSLFKGGTFALASVLLLEIVVQPEGRLLRLVLWLASFVCAVTSYNAWLNSSVVDFRESVGGILFIIIQMMTELVLFATLTPRVTEQAWRGWVFVYGMFMAVTAVRMLLFGMNRNVEIDAGIRPMIDAMYRESLQVSWRMLVIAAIAMALTVPIAILPQMSPWPQWLSMGFAVVVGALSVLALNGMQRERVMMEKALQDALGRQPLAEPGPGG